MLSKKPNFNKRMFFWVLHSKVVDPTKHISHNERPKTVLGSKQQIKQGNAFLSVYLKERYFYFCRWSEANPPSIHLLVWIVFQLSSASQTKHNLSDPNWARSMTTFLTLSYTLFLAISQSLSLFTVPFLFNCYHVSFVIIKKILPIICFCHSGATHITS